MQENIEERIKRLEQRLQSEIDFNKEIRGYSLKLHKQIALWLGIITFGLFVGVVIHICQ